MMLLLEMLIVVLLNTFVLLVQENLTKDDAREQFLRILRTLPYGSSVFFSVRKIDDPIGLLPGKIILGINKRGVSLEQLLFVVAVLLILWEFVIIIVDFFISWIWRPIAQVHFFRPVPKEYLHSAELRDIMQFGSSNTAVFFKMRVAGVLHIFQFETKQVFVNAVNHLLIDIFLFII